MNGAAQAVVDAFGDARQRGRGGDEAITVVRRSTVPTAALRLSVVVPCFNMGPLAVEAVQSILRQSMSALEVIAVDDGSTDDTLARLLEIDDARLTCITQVNRGLAGARNTGVRHARAPFVGFCDADDVWYPQKAAKQLAVMEADPSIGLTFSYSAYLDENGRPTGQLLLSRCRRPTTRDMIERNHVGNGSTPIVRRECFDRAGLFDETLQSFEDLEMWVRLSVRSPHTLQLIPEPLTGYRVRSGSQMHTFEKYLAGIHLHLERFRGYVPGYGDRAANRTYAEHFRILSRKAFASGEIVLSRRFFLEAVRHSPTLVMRDVRAAAMAILHLIVLPLPKRLQTVPYRLGCACLAMAYGRLMKGA